MRLSLWLAGVITMLFVSSAVLADDFRQITLQQFGSGNSVTLASLSADKPVYVKMWATWCKPCMEQMPHFEALQQQYGDKVNFVAVNININENNDKIAQVIKRFNLTMPVWLDNEGQLGVALGLTGTPYSVLINSKNDVVYTTHESDSNLDRFISMLAKGQALKSAATDALTAEQKHTILQNWQQGEQLVFFTATWCDWYLLDTRPEMANACKQAQTQLNSLQQQLPDRQWRGVVNHLWTDEQALAEFNLLYNITVPFSIDEAGVLFNHFNIRTIPTLLVIKDGKVQQRITDFSNTNSLVQQLSGH
ncbi:redoxin family protein [Rheinheimera aquimaris]|nr:redoxin family protein [Rheinheimera aquimaris]MCB5212295.1 redoxin family protein [Rheinheimera aquimaris]